MNRRVGMFCAVVAIVALGIAIAGSAAGASGGPSKQRGVRVVAVITEVNQVDAAPAGESLGDQIVFSSKLLKGAREVGHQGAVCTTVSLARHEAECIATYAFRDGQITGQALVKLGDRTPYAVPVTGGSGRYAGARGEVHVRPVSDTQGVLTFTPER